MDGYERAAAGGAPARPFTVGYFARVAPEKGLHVLADAYVRFRAAWQDARRCGSRPPATWRRPSRAYLDRVRADARAGGAGRTSSPIAARSIARASWRFCAGLDVLSVPATYDEPKGLFLLEAMASGVPVVQPRRGAFVEIVEKTGGGLLVEPDDPEQPGRRALRALERSREPGAAWPTRVSTACARTTRIAQSADRLLDVYRAHSGTARMASTPCLNVSHVSKHYPTPRGPLTVLSDVSLSLAPGEAAAITGPSGQRQELAALPARRARAAVGRDGHARRTESVRALGAGISPTSATRRSGSSSRITACCRSARCSRTCSCRRWWTGRAATNAE